MKQTNNRTKKVAPTTKYFKDIFTRKIYEVKPGQLKEYGFYSNRYTIAIMLGILLNNFTIGNEVILGITVGLIVLLEYRYRRSFLPSLSVRNQMNVEKTVGKEALIMNTILYLVLGGLLIAYSLSGSLSETYQWLMTALGVGSLGVFGMYLSELLATK